MKPDSRVPGYHLVRFALISAGVSSFLIAATISPAAEGGSVVGKNTWKDVKTGVEFVRIPKGEFAMGSVLRDNEKPVHRVRLSEFWLAKSEVTQAQWLLVMGNRPSSHRNCDDCPVELVSWMDVHKYLEKTGYRLPTEAEWEYAAGGGAAHQRWAGTNDSGNLGTYAWSRSNSMRVSHPVCTREPNLFGLCDMTGNVYEWCADWYEAGYYRVSLTENPTGPKSGTLRVARGGSWVLDPSVTGVTLRLSSLPSARHAYIGFRPALSAAPPGSAGQE